jgi:glucose-1-phosphate cytidylyltransferase
VKVVLFCGGKGMRLREFSDTVPKPMVPIGYRPVLWHLMRYYAHYGHTDFILCLGYRADAIKQYFLDYKEWLSNDFVLSGGGADVELLQRDIDEWRITFVDTGLNANIGERLMAVRHLLEDDDVFLANYADGLTDAPLPALIDHFEQQDKTATFLCVPPSQTFHVVETDEKSQVLSIRDATKADLWVNGGYFVLRNDIFDYMRPGEELVVEPFNRLIDAGELSAYRYDGFWLGMDTFKDREVLEQMFQDGTAPWEVWKHEPR